MLLSPALSPPLHKSSQPSISRKPPAWLWETVSCLLRKKEKEIFPQASCFLDKVFCLCTNTGTQGAVEKAFALWNMAQNYWTRYTCFNIYIKKKKKKIFVHIILFTDFFVHILNSTLKKKDNYCLESQHIEMSVFCIMHISHLLQEIMSFPSSTFSRALSWRNVSMFIQWPCNTDCKFGKWQLTCILQLCHTITTSLLTSPSYLGTCNILLTSVDTKNIWNRTASVYFKSTSLFSDRLQLSLALSGIRRTHCQVANTANAHSCSQYKQ